MKIKGRRCLNDWNCNVCKKLFSKDITRYYKESARDHLFCEDCFIEYMAPYDHYGVTRNEN